MIPLTTLWLPILLSAVIVFVASNILWMALPFWHRGDYGKAPDEQRLLDALSAAKSGQYMVPLLDRKKQTPEECAEMMKGPMALIVLRNPAAGFSFPVALISYYVYALVISILVAYICAVTLRTGATYLEVFRIAGTAGILAYSFGSIADSIWYGKPWAVTIKIIVDGVIYGLLIAGTFGWLWPR
jgi:hypothetical protein